MTPRISRAGGAFAGALILLFSSGCAMFGSLSHLPPEEQVRIRAQAWADALLAGDLEGAYAYTSPTYRGFASPGIYHARVEGTVRWKGAEVSEVTCEEGACEATLIVEYEARGMNVTVRRPRQYTWVESGGKWWIYVPPK